MNFLSVVVSKQLRGSQNSTGATPPCEAALTIVRGKGKLPDSLPGRFPSRTGGWGYEGIRIRKGS